MNVIKRKGNLLLELQPYSCSIALENNVPITPHIDQFPT
jgi:hypothetical protein